MSTTPTVFNDVSLLITHYNRSLSLERLLKAFKEQNVVFAEIVVSDDASKPEHQQYMQELKKTYDFRLVSGSKNGGLANNLNKGQDAVKTPYTLYVQEDFVPLESFLPHLADALDLMKEDASIDLARFYSNQIYPYLKPYKKGFSEVLYRPWYLNPHKIYNYTDLPNLHRSNFFDKFGYFKEGIKSDRAEYLMCISFIQNKGKAIFYDDFHGLFKHINSDDEPSTVARGGWRQSNNFLMPFVKWAYRTLKYNYDIHLGGSLKQPKQ